MAVAILIVVRGFKFPDVINKRQHEILSENLSIKIFNVAFSHGSGYADVLIQQVKNCGPDFTSLIFKKFLAQADVP